MTAFCKEKDIARQTIYDLIEKKKLNAIKLGYARFIVMDKLAINYKKTEIRKSAPAA